MHCVIVCNCLCLVEEYVTVAKDKFGYGVDQVSD